MGFRCKRRILPFPTFSGRCLPFRTTHSAIDRRVISEVKNTVPLASSQKNIHETTKQGVIIPQHRRQTNVNRKKKLRQPLYRCCNFRLNTTAAAAVAAAVGASCELTLQQADHPFPHAHVHVRLGSLEVVVQVVAEPREQRDRLLLTTPLHVLREDHCRTAPKNDTAQHNTARMRSIVSAAQHPVHQVSIHTGAKASESPQQQQ